MISFSTKQKILSYRDIPTIYIGCEEDQCYLVFLDECDIDHGVPYEKYIAYLAETKDMEQVLDEFMEKAPEQIYLIMVKRPVGKKQREVRPIQNYDRDYCLLVLNSVLKAYCEI